jgi:hypothetical protein
VRPPPAHDGRSKWVDPSLRRHSRDRETEALFERDQRRILDGIQAESHLARRAPPTARLHKLEHHPDADRAAQRLGGDPHVVDVRGPSHERAGEVAAEPAIDDPGQYEL